MRVALCSLVLNEQEFLLWNYAQHRHWPGLVSWVFIEAADKLYAAANPGRVTSEGLSTDETRAMLEGLKQTDNRINYECWGWMARKEKALAKTVGRNRYLAWMEDIQPDIFIVVDADEFYTEEDQRRIIQIVEDHPEFLSFLFPQRHIWYPPSLTSSDTFQYEVVGGYWTVPHVRVFRWQTGIRYLRNHNWPEARDYNPTRYMYKGGLLQEDPQCIHLGFARRGEERQATNRYYEQRGEGRQDGRQMYVDCRAAWENWQPGGKLPHGARVISYTGPVPEVYLAGNQNAAQEQGKG